MRVPVAIGAVLLAASVLSAGYAPAGEPVPAAIEDAIAVWELAGAERLNPPTTPSTGLWGQPFAPDGLSDCDEMSFYRRQWGLPAAFDGIGWRESNCRNEDIVKTFCCHGYWQMYTSLHVRDHRLASKMAACEVFSHHDLNSDDPREKQRQACAAKSLYDVMGTSPWSATT